jgi:hypothetical protein
MSIGVGIFLMVLGAILAFAVEATTPGINVNTLGIILLLTGLIAVLYSLLFWSDLSPWGSAQKRCPPPHGGRGATGRGYRGAPPRRRSSLAVRKTRSAARLDTGRPAIVATAGSPGVSAVIGGDRLCKQG